MVKTCWFVYIFCCQWMQTEQGRRGGTTWISSWSPPGWTYFCIVDSGWWDVWMDRLLIHREKCWYLMNRRHVECRVAEGSPPQLRPRWDLIRPCDSQLSNKISLLCWGASWQENLTSAHRELWFPTKTGFQTQRSPWHSRSDHRPTMHFTSSPEPQGPDGRLPFDIWQFLSSVFWINCQIGPFTRNHKCQQMSRKCQGLRVEGDSGAVQAHQPQRGPSSSFFQESMLQQSYYKNSNKKSIKLEDVCVKGLDRSSTSSGAVIDPHTPTDGIHWEQFSAFSFPKLLVFLSCMM